MYEDISGPKKSRNKNSKQSKTDNAVYWQNTAVTLAMLTECVTQAKFLFWTHKTQIVAATDDMPKKIEFRIWNSEFQNQVKSLWICRLYRGTFDETLLKAEEKWHYSDGTIVERLG